MLRVYFDPGVYESGGHRRVFHGMLGGYCGVGRGRIVRDLVWGSGGDPHGNEYPGGYGDKDRNNYRHGDEYADADFGEHGHPHADTDAHEYAVPHAH